MGCFRVETHSLSRTWRSSLAYSVLASQKGRRCVSSIQTFPSLLNGTNLSIVRVALGALEVVDEHRALPRKLVPQPAKAMGTGRYKGQ